MALREMLERILKAIGTLGEGIPVQYDIATDFAVLCANCHRMIHRYTDPSDLKSFRALKLQAIASAEKADSHNDTLRNCPVGTLRDLHCG
jgi:hypothetical protein